MRLWPFHRSPDPSPAIASSVLSTEPGNVALYAGAAQAEIATPTTGAPLEERRYAAPPVESFPMLPELSPLQIRGLLWSSMHGNFSAAYDLFSLIQDSAPRFLINLHQVRELAARATIKINPAIAAGQKKPSLRATERRDFIDWALQQFRPSAQDDEAGYSDTIYDQLGSMLQPTISEVMYHRRDGLWVPRATAWITPRKYALDASRRLGLVPWNGADAMSRPMVEPLEAQKFLVSIYKTRGGSMTMSGIGRPLGWWWGAMMYGRKWLLQTAQRFSIPFMHIKYATGTSPSDVATLQQLAAQWGANGHAETLDSIAIEFIENNWNAQNNPQDWLIEKFDYYCDLMILRETRASDIGRESIKGGSAQAGEMKQTQVECVEAIAQFVCMNALDQLIRHLCILNYGDDEDCPYAWPDFTKATTPKEKADTVLTLKQAGWVRSQAEMQEEFNMELEPAPEPVAPDPFGFPGAFRDRGTNGNGNGAPKKNGALEAEARPSALSDALAEDFAEFRDRFDALANVADPDEFAAGLKSLQEAIDALRIDPAKSALADQLEAAMAGAVLRALESSSPSSPDPRSPTAATTQNFERS